MTSSGSNDQALPEEPDATLSESEELRKEAETRLHPKERHSLNMKSVIVVLAVIVVVGVIAYLGLLLYTIQKYISFDGFSLSPTFLIVLFVTPFAALTAIIVTGLTVVFRREQDSSVPIRQVLDLLRHTGLLTKSQNGL